MTQSSPHPEPLPVAFRAELDALLATLELSAGTFSLSLAICNSPALRDRLSDEVRRRRSSVERLDLPAGLVDVYGFVKEHAQPGRSEGLLVTGLEGSVSSRDTDNQSLRSLNASRDLWEAQFPRPVIFLLPEYAARELTSEAVDFTRYLSHRFGFTNDAPMLPPVDRSLPAAEWMTASQLSTDEKQSRIQELRSRLVEVDSRAPYPLSRLTNWTTELSFLLAMSGESEAAEQVCRDLLPRALSRPEAPAAALLYSQIADVLQARGELDEALRIRREEELPVYERLGDVRAKAVTQGQIADVLQARGELDEALRIRREEQLPVYGRLGDAREKATCWGRVADVLQARGELDEALRIRREEELPVYERLGDVRAKAVTQGKIADVLQARGELDEALRIRREEQLPVYERLGDEFSLVRARARVARWLLQRNAPGDREEAAELLRQAHAAAEKMGIPEADQIREIQKSAGL
jgi:tetratricopeptide (TPR) repeat protein